jgi:molybdenum cofactor synthesis domain-containing protein
MSKIKTLLPEVISFHRAVGRALAEDIVADAEVPPFNRSAMDGFAVRASDTFGATPQTPVRLRIIGSLRAGELPKDRVKKGEAMEIMTGAKLPNGADAVVMVEHTKATGKTLEVFFPVTPGKNISKRGEDVRAGRPALKRGKLLQPHDIGMLASLGKTRIKVFRKPKVAIVTTGQELVKPGSKVPAGKIVDSNAYSLAAAVEKCQGLPRIVGRIKDDRESIQKVIRGSIRDDLILISGGSSVGKFDLVPEVIAELGKIVFHGVSIRPGGPTAFGIVKGKPIYALAGFPVATLVAFHLLVRPALLAMQGLPPDYGQRFVKAELTENTSSSLGRLDVVRVKLEKKEKRILASPIRISGSGILSSMTRADGFFTISENLEGVRKGEVVKIELF